MKYRLDPTAPQGISRDDNDGVIPYFQDRVGKPSLLDSVNGKHGAVQIEGGTNVTVDNSGTAIKISASGSGGGGAVDSVNGATGTVVLDADDISDASTTNKFVTSSDITNLSNLSGTNTGDQDLSGYLLSATAASTYEPIKGADDNYVTDAEKVIIGNTSGTNTGDQDLSSLALKTNVLELDNTVAFTPDADYEPATKKYVDDSITAGGGYTDEQAQDAVGTILTDSTEIALTYSDATPSITAAIKSASIDETKLDASVNASLDLADSATQPGDLAAVATSGDYTDLSNTPTVPSTFDDLTDGTTNKAFTSTLKGKLDNIEANADVTDTSNVTAAGALMDSEVTNLAQVKAFDSSDYATAAQGSLADTAVQNLSDLSITASATELNYTDGVTSAIQTQLDAKLEDVDIADINATGTASGTTYLRGDGTWSTPAGGGSGNVVGPASSTDNGLVVFDDTTGELVRDASGWHFDQGDGPDSVLVGKDLALSVGASTNSIGEYTPGSGVTIDGVLIKDGGVTLNQSSTLKAQNISPVSGGSTMNIGPGNTGDVAGHELSLGADTVTLNAVRVKVDTIAEKTAAAGVTIDGVLVKDGEVDGRDVSADGSKLDGIESGADVTDSTNVQAALPSGSNGQVLKHNGTSWAAGTDNNTTYSEISEANIENTSSSSAGLITGRRAEALMDNEASKTRTLTNKTLVTPKIGQIDEASAGAGVSIDGVILRDTAIELSGHGMFVNGSGNLALYATAANVTIDEKVGIGKDPVDGALDVDGDIYSNGEKVETKAKVGIISGSNFSSLGAKTVSISFGFTPKIIRFSVVTPTSTSGYAQFSTGAVDSSLNQWSQSIAVSSGVGSGRSSSTTRAIEVINTASNVYVAAAVTAMNQNGITFNVTTANTAYDIGYEAIG